MVLAIRCYDQFTCSGLLVLDLGHNEIAASGQAPLPSTLFVNCTELRHLDLSYNRIEMLPAPLRSATNLTSLSLAGNPLGASSMRPLLACANLETLDLRDTGRNAAGIPDELGSSLPNLRQLELNGNMLDAVPPGLLNMPALERLDLSDNAIVVLPGAIAGWTGLVMLNVSRNKLTALPAAVGSLSTLRALYANHNGIVELPVEMARLTKLQQLRLAGNALTSVPVEVLEGCKAVRTLKLHDNQLKTLPAAVHDLDELIALTVEDNEGFKMPAKRGTIAAGTDSLEAFFAGYAAAGAAGSPARKHSRRRLLGLRDQSEQGRTASPQKMASKDLQRGMDMVAGVVAKSTDRTAAEDCEHDALEEAMGALVKPKEVRNWSATMFGDTLDYSELFDAETGRTAGISSWRIEQFVPARLRGLEHHGVFASGDCYIVLSTRSIPKGEDSIDCHEVYFWIGATASIDKKASAAINAIQLRDFLQVAAIIRREEEGEESDGFKSLYDGNFEVVEGGTESGFYEVERPDHIERLYRLSGGRNIRADPLPCSTKMLTAGSILLLDTADTLYLWRGSSIGYVEYHRIRLFCERVLRGPSGDGQSLEQIVEIDQGQEQQHPAFHSRFVLDDDVLCELDYTTPESRSRIFEVKLGHGFLELPQIASKTQHYRRDCLRTTGVYIVDNHADLFVWYGADSSKLVQSAAERLVEQIERTSPRPAHVMITYLSEGLESAIFKTNFFGWDDVIQPDHRESGPIDLDPGHPGAIPDRADLKDLFSAARPVMSGAEAIELEEKWRDDLEKCDAYVLQNRNFVRMGPEDFGTFHSENCYVFLCKEWHLLQGSDGSAGSGELEDDEDPPEESECTAYFWQGRDAGMMGWLIFQHSFINEIRPLIAKQFDIPELRVIREFQTRESMRFMALFDRKMVVHQGHLRDEALKSTPQLFHIHSWRPLTYTRTIEVPCKPGSLNSHGAFLLKVPTNGGDDGIVYLWLGSQVAEEDRAIARALPITEMWEDYTFKTIAEGTEAPERFFWSTLPGPEPKFDRAFGGIRGTRVFECACLGGFTVQEIIPQVIHQDSLDEHLAYIVSSQGSVYLWIGHVAGEVLRKWSSGAAREYAKRSMATLELDAPDVTFVEGGCEPFEFTRLFHGWGRSIQKTIDLARPIPYLRHVLDPLPPQPVLHRRHPEAPFYLHLRETVRGRGDPVFDGEGDTEDDPAKRMEEIALLRARMITPSPMPSPNAKNPILSAARFRRITSSPATPGTSTPGSKLNSSRLSARKSSSVKVSRRKSRLSLMDLTGKTSVGSLFDDFECEITCPEDLLNLAEAQRERAHSPLSLT